LAVGSELVRARAAVGYSQEDVGNAIGVSRAMVSYWESEKRNPSDRQLVALAHLYGVETGRLLGETSDEVRADLAQMMFRDFDGDMSPQAHRGIQEFVSFLDAYSRLASAASFDIRGLKSTPFSFVQGFDSVEDARRKAEEVRAHLRLGMGPIGDVDVICELLGITVYRAALGEDLRTAISGAFLKHPGVGFSILVNLEMTPGRRRFTVAHELAHALFHSDRETFVISRPGDEGIERFANAFAGEFLMPAEGIRRAMEEYGIGPRIMRPADVVHLQRFFRVSYATALFRLRQARLISAQYFEEFQQVRPVLFAQQLGYEPSEEEFERDVDRWRIRRFPPKFLLLLRRAIASQVISGSTAAGLTGLSIDEVEELMFEERPVDSETRAELDDFRAVGMVNG
jgi:Zn-dependent peptidase ImmA (M78 family)/transcriptional regulator with XRE-family HTH domain